MSRLFSSLKLQTVPVPKRFLPNLFIMVSATLFVIIAANKKLEEDTHTALFEVVT